MAKLMDVALCGLCCISKPGVAQNGPVFRMCVGWVWHRHDQLSMPFEVRVAASLFDSYTLMKESSYSDDCHNVFADPPTKALSRGEPSLFSR